MYMMSLMIGYLNTKNTGSDAEVFRPEAYPAGNLLSELRLMYRLYHSDSVEEK